MSDWSERVGWVPYHSVLYMVQIVVSFLLAFFFLSCSCMQRQFWEFFGSWASLKTVIFKCFKKNETNKLAPACTITIYLRSNDSSLNYNPSIYKDAYLRDYNYYSRWHRSDTVPRNKMPRFQSPLSTKDCT